LAAERPGFQPGVAEEQVAKKGFEGDFEAQMGVVPEVPVCIDVAGRGTPVSRGTNRHKGKIEEVERSIR
jgi:hypothetical protein